VDEKAKLLAEVMGADLAMLVRMAERAWSHLPAGCCRP
jgi:hypothetical protein